MFLFSLLRSLLLLRRRPLILYTATWTALLTLTVAVASFSPEVAFVWAASPSSSFARACGGGGGSAGDLVRVPLDGPAGDVVCVPARLFVRSKVVDLVVPPLFAALVVAGSAFFVRAVGVWEAGEEEEEGDGDFLDRRL